MTEDPIQEMAARYEAGASLRAVAVSVGRSASYVRDRLLERGVRMRPQGGARPPLPRPSDAELAEIGAALRRVRVAAGLSIDDAARILDCHRSKISRVETGQRCIRPKELRELLAAYGVDEQEFRGG